MIPVIGLAKLAYIFFFQKQIRRNPVLVQLDPLAVRFKSVTSFHLW